jgi:hypothetical protein
MTLGSPLDLTLTALLVARRFGLARTILYGFLLTPAILWSLPPQPCGCIRPLFVRCSGGREGAYRAAMKSDLKNLASQEEIHFSDVGSYSSDLDEIQFVASNGVSVTVVMSVDGWGASSTHAALGDGSSCALYVGKEPPPGMGLQKRMPGEIVCTG